jgi:hypothetical protein
LIPPIGASPQWQKGITDDRRGCYWLYVVTHCDTEPRLQAIRDPAALPWDEVKRVDHYWLSVDAATSPLRVRGTPRDVEGP